jgi:hypothetical protein
MSRVTRRLKMSVSKKRVLEEARSTAERGRQKKYEEVQLLLTAT